MIDLDYQALREVAEKVANHEPEKVFPCGACLDFRETFNPATVLRLLDEVERLQERIQLDGGAQQLYCKMGKEIEKLKAEAASLRSENERLKDSLDLQRRAVDGLQMSYKNACKRIEELGELCSMHTTAASESAIDYDLLKTRLTRAEAQLERLRSVESVRSSAPEVVLTCQNCEHLSDRLAKATEALRGYAVDPTPYGECARAALAQISDESVLTPQKAGLAALEGGGVMKDLKVTYTKKEFLERIEYGIGKDLVLSEQFGVYFLLTKNNEILFRLSALAEMGEGEK